MADMQSRVVESHKNQTTVLAGPGKNVSLTACAHQIMAQVGLTCLLETKCSFLGDQGKSVPVQLGPDFKSVQLLAEPPQNAKWLVVEHFADGVAPRASAFLTKQGAATQFSVKLAMQELGSVTVEYPNASSEPTIRYAGQGNSGITGLIMTQL